MFEASKRVESSRARFSGFAATDHQVMPMTADTVINSCFGIGECPGSTRNVEYHTRHATDHTEPCPRISSRLDLHFANKGLANTNTQTCLSLLSAQATLSTITKDLCSAPIAALRSELNMPMMSTRLSREPASVAHRGLTLRHADCCAAAHEKD